EPLDLRCRRQPAGHDHLEGDEPVERLLPCLEDDAHPALGDLPDQLIIAEAGPFLGRQGWTSAIRIRFGPVPTRGGTGRHGLVNGLSRSTGRAVGTRHLRSKEREPLAVLMTFRDRRIHGFLGSHPPAGATAPVYFACFVSRRVSSQTFTVLSKLAEARRFPSGLNATRLTTLP